MQKNPKKHEKQAVLNNFCMNIRHEMGETKLEDVREGRTEKEQGGLHFARGVDS